MSVRKFAKLFKNNRNLEFPTISNSDETQLVTNNLMNSLYCEKCGLLEFNQLIRHFLNHHFQKSSYCNQQHSKQHPKQYPKQNHKSQSIKSSNCTCEKCQEKFITFSELNMNSVKQESVETAYICIQCLFTSNDFKKVMLHHKDNHHGIRCMFCSTQFYLSSSFDKYNSKNIRDKEFNYQLEQLYKHLSMHIVSNYFLKCPNCNLSFNSKSDLIYHSLIHSIRLYCSDSNLKIQKLCSNAYLSNLDFNECSIKFAESPIVRNKKVVNKLKFDPYEEFSDKMIANFLKESSKKHNLDAILNELISHNPILFLQWKFSEIEKTSMEILISLDDINKDVLKIPNCDPMIKKIALKCDLCHLPIENFEQHFSKKLLECPSSCKFQTYCFAAMNIHKEQQFKNSYDNIFFNGHSEIPRFAEISNEQLIQAAEYNGTYVLADEIEDIKNDFPDDPSPYYVICCKKCCIIFPTMKDAALHPFICQASSLDKVILTRQSLIRPLRHIDPNVELIYRSKSNSFWRSALKSVRSEISSREEASTSRPKKRKCKGK